jgi:predicted dienelactone hydrolase
MLRFVPLLAFALAACASGAPLRPRPAIETLEHPVGMITRDYVDTERRNWEGTGPRPLRTAVWYPASATAAMTESVSVGLFEGGLVAPSAPVAPQRSRYPLVVLSHGTGGSAFQMMWLGRFLASRGFIVAAVNHHGNTGSEPQRRAEGFLLYWERARDLSRVLDRVLADDFLGPRIDRARIGAAGFSLGGFTVLLAGGARFSSAQYDAFCASPGRDYTCEPQPEHPTAHAEFARLRNDPVVAESLRRSGESYRDARIKAVFAIAPALGSGLAEHSLRALRLPVRIVVGDADVTTPAATNAARIAGQVPGSHLDVLAGVTHYTFLNTCSARGVEVLDLCRERASVDRRATHRRVGELALDFFRTSLD